MGANVVKLPVNKGAEIQKFTNTISIKSNYLQNVTLNSSHNHFWVYLK